MRFVWRTGWPCLPANDTVTALWMIVLACGRVEPRVACEMTGHVVILSRMTSDLCLRL